MLLNIFRVKIQEVKVTNLNASMTKEDTGDTPARPGCQDSDTLFLVTSVTWGLEGGPGSSFSLWLLVTITPPDSTRTDRQQKTKQVRRECNMLKPINTTVDTAFHLWPPGRHSRMSRHWSWWPHMCRSPSLTAEKHERAHVFKHTDIIIAALTDRHNVITSRKQNFQPHRDSSHTLRAAAAAAATGSSVFCFLLRQCWTYAKRLWEAAFCAGPNCVSFVSASKCWR